jgi:hypothetical protein
MPKIGGDSARRGVVAVSSDALFHFYRSFVDVLRHAIRGHCTKTLLWHDAAMTTHDENAPKLYTVSEAAVMLRMSVKDLRAVTHPRGSLTALKIGRVIRYSERALREYRNRPSN